MTRVLVIDDSAFTLRSHRELLEQLDVEVFCAKGGEEGIEKFEEIQPDIVLCDIMMPDLNGYEVLEVVKENCEDIFWFFVSGEMSPEIQNKASELGAQGVLEKPLDLSAMKIVLQLYPKKI